MEKYSHYTIFRSKTAIALERIVESALAEGFVPIGGPVRITNAILIQAVALPPGAPRPKKPVPRHWRAKARAAKEAEEMRAEFEENDDAI